MNIITNQSRTSGKFRQWLATITVNLSAMSYGIALGWSSPIIPKLKSNHPPVGTSPLNDYEISWISSLLAMGCCLSIPFSGFLAERFGRKAFGYSIGFLLITSWLLIIFGSSHVYYLYAARLIAGMSSSMSAFIVPLYVSEIASEEIRGSLGCLLIFSVKIGILFAYVAGAYLSYRLFAILSLIFPIVFVFAFAFTPETPVYLVRQNRLDQAHKSLMFFKANNRPAVEEQLAKLKAQADHSNDSAIKVNIAYLYRDRATRKALIISLGIIVAQQLCGILAMISYAVPIFRASGTSLSAENAAITIAVIQVFGSYVSTMLMDGVGRRLLALYSSLGMALSHSIVAVFFYLQQYKYDVSCISWLPLVAVSSFMLSYCLGMGPMPWVVTSEIFRHEVASLATCLCFVVLWTMSFFIVKTFDLALKTLGGGCFLMLAAFCMAGFVFVYYVLPETKGCKREDIIDELAGIAGDNDLAVTNGRARRKNFVGEKAV